MKLVWLDIVMVTVCVHAGPCQPDEERFGNSCYRLQAGLMTWRDAAQSCRDMGGGLAVPDSPDEHQFLWKKFTETVTEGHVWIGCSDMEEEGKYVQPGEEERECTYFNWAPGEPNPAYRADGCIQLSRASGGRWNDAWCGDLCSVICEWSIIPIITPSISCLEKYGDALAKDHCLTGHVIEELPAKGVVACATACREEPGCRSFNLRSGSRGDRICELNSITRDTAHVKDITHDITCNYFHF